MKWSSPLSAQDVVCHCANDIMYRVLYKPRDDVWSPFDNYCDIYDDIEASLLDQYEPRAVPVESQ